MVKHHPPSITIIPISRRMPDKSHSLCHASVPYHRDHHRGKKRYTGGWNDITIIIMSSVLFIMSHRVYNYHRPGELYSLADRHRRGGRTWTELQRCRSRSAYRSELGSQHAIQRNICGICICLKWRLKQEVVGSMETQTKAKYRWRGEVLSLRLFQLAKPVIKLSYHFPLGIYLSILH